ncbi:MAG: hypothetical protein HKL83_04360 [Acidimicrobiaceae bacterium]|nr:hypothetical protein [Acidimicrobiaceae bacterium]
MKQRVLLADADPNGRMRLDAISRVLQDAATLDVENTSLTKKGPWVIRWMEMTAHGLPRYLEELAIETFCSGLGRAWAERSTVIKSKSASVTATANWVLLDDLGRSPIRLSEEFLSVYGRSANGKVSSPRLHLLQRLGDFKPSEKLEIPLRFCDLDIMGHMNNAVHLALVEESLFQLGLKLLDEFSYRIEFLAEIEPNAPVVIEHRESDSSTLLALVQNEATKSIVELSQVIH